MQRATEECIAYNPDECRGYMRKLSARGRINFRFFIKQYAEKHNADGIYRENYVSYCNKQGVVHIYLPLSAQMYKNSIQYSIAQAQHFVNTRAQLKYRL